MHGGRRQGNAVAGAHALDLAHFVEHVRRGRGVVVGRACDRSGGEDARVEHAAEHDADVLSDRERQHLGERGLLEQRVAPGNQHAVEIAVLQEAHRVFGIVGANADTFDDALAAQFLERFVGAFHGFAVALGAFDGTMRPRIGVMDQQHVDFRQTQAQQRVLV